MDVEKLNKEVLCKKICGEIVLSEHPGKTIKKWREIFKIPQHELAKEIDVMPSVISDYESGRRKSPGIKIIKKIVLGMINIDEKNGGNVTKEFYSLTSDSLSNIVLDMLEFVEPVSMKEFLKTIKAKTKFKLDKEIFGYTVIDSIKAIVNSSPEELVKIYGSTTERALIFTNVSTGRSPMVAIKVTSLRPALVVLHGLNKIDEIAMRIAEIENIPLAITNMQLDQMIKALRKRFS